MAFDQIPHDSEAPDFVNDLKKVFAPGTLTTALHEDLQTLASLSDEELQSKGLTRNRVERAVRRKHIQSLYG